MPSAPEPATQWTDEFLEPMRTIGDPPADAAIDGVFAGGVAAVNALMSDLVRNDEMEPASLPEPLQHLLALSDTLPEWADRAKIEAGERVFWRFGPRIGVLLYCYSLPFCYAARKGVQVLALTTRLSGNPRRRIIETAQMLIDILQPGGLTTAGGHGRRTIQKVRLMHGAVRRLAQMAPGWKQQYGIPVNQEDLALTLMSFSWVTLDGLEKLGIRLSPEDQDAYVHFWRVVGHMLGLRDDLNPDDVGTANALAEAVARRQFAASAEGCEMTRALTEMLEYTLPGTLFDTVPSLLIRYFLGRERAGMIGIDDRPFVHAAAAPLRLGGQIVGDVLRDSRAVAALAERMGQVLVQSIVFVERGGNRPSFRIPAELRQTWGVNWTS